MKTNKKIPKEIIVASFNWKNNLGLTTKNKAKHDSDVLTNFVLKHKINFLGTQELTKKRLSSFDLKNYTIFGKERFKKFGLLFPLNLINESNPIFSIYDSSSDETIFLPNKGTILPRIITIRRFENITFCNTHLTLSKRKNSKDLQLNAIYEIVREEIKNGREVILTGDFNMTLKNKAMKKYISKFEKIGLIRVPINENTCKTVFSGPLDHIFIPKAWELIDYKSYDLNISDHKLIMCKVKR